MWAGYQISEHSVAVQHKAKVSPKEQVVVVRAQVEVQPLDGGLTEGGKGNQQQDEAHSGGEGKADADAEESAKGIAGRRCAAESETHTSQMLMQTGQADVGKIVELTEKFDTDCDALDKKPRGGTHF